MMWAERVSIVDVLHSDPALFWILMHIGWGALYGAGTLATFFIALASAQYLKQHDSKKYLLLAVQLIWAIGLLIGGLAIPLMFSLIDKRVLIEGQYIGYCIAAWALSCSVYFWGFRRLGISMH